MKDKFFTSKIRKDLMIYTVLFLFISIIGFIPLWMNRRLPMFFNDGVGQYYRIFLYTGHWIRTFWANLFDGIFAFPTFDLSIGMGEDIIGSLGYYGFGNPLNLLAVFATQKTGPYLFSFLIFLRLYLSGIAVYAYCNEMKCNHRYAVPCIMVYVFCNFAMTAGLRYPEMTTAMIYFPLILTGCEEVMKGKKSYLLIASVFFSALCGFYFLYMISIYLVVYCLVRIGFIYGKKNVKLSVQRILTCIFHYIIGIFLAAPIFIPAIEAVFRSNRSGLSIGEILFDYSNWIPSIYLCKLFVLGVRAGTDFYYWYEIPLLEYCLIGVTVFFIRKNTKSLQCFLAVVCGVIAWSLPITSYILCAFSNYWRWTFMLQFTFCIVMICSIENLRNRYLDVKKRKRVTSILTVGITVNVIISLFIHNALPADQNYDGIAWKDHFLTYDETVDYSISPVKYSDKIMNDDGLYRIGNDSLSDINVNPDNLGMSNQYYSQNFWFSLVNGTTQDYVNQLESKNIANWRSDGFLKSSILGNLAATKYYIASDQNEIAGYESVETISYHGEEWNILMNASALPFMYCYKDTISNDIFQQLSAIEKISSQLYFASVQDGQEKELSDKEEKIRNSILEMKGDVETLSSGKVRITFKVQEDSEVFVEIDQNEIISSSDCKVYIDQKQKTDCKSYSSRDYLCGLGKVQKATDICVEVENVDQNLQRDIVKIIHVYGISEKSIQEQMNELGKEEILVEQNGNTFQGHVDLEEEKLLVLAIPYSQNWKLFVNGEKVPIQKVNSIYMGVFLPEGNHDVVFKYIPKGFIVGCLLCIIVVLGYVIAKIVHLKKRW